MICIKRTQKSAFFLFKSDIYIKTDNMAKAIINKHIDNASDIDSSLFLTDSELSKGEIVICNDTNNPSIYIKTNDGEIAQVAGGDSGDNANETYIKEPIVVAGIDGKFGAGNYSNGDVISTGTSIYEILQNILCREMYPENVSTRTASVKVDMKKLSASLNLKGEVEVGTSISLMEAKTNGITVTAEPSSIFNMAYGYSTSDNDTVESNNTSINSECVTSISDNLYTISATISKGFDADEINLPETKSNEGDVELEETVIGCAGEGENKITISATGASYSYSAEPIDRVYYCSNLGNTDSTKYNVGLNAVEGTTEKPTISSELSIKGVYKYFLGYSSKTSFNDFNSTDVRSLTDFTGNIVKDGVTTILDNSTIAKSNGSSIVIACPSKYKLSTINNGIGASIIDNFTSRGTVQIATGEIQTPYNIYVYPITNNVTVEFKNVTLAKA